MSLVLSRKEGEKIMIGGDIVVTVLEMRGNTIRIGVDAPLSISVHKEETWRKIKRLDAIAAGDGPELHGKTEFPPPEHGNPVG